MTEEEVEELYIPLRSYKTIVVIPDNHVRIIFISHYVHIKPCIFWKTSTHISDFISHYVHIKRKIYVIIAGWLKELYIPLRSYKTTRPKDAVTREEVLYIPLRSYKTSPIINHNAARRRLYIPLRSYKTCPCNLNAVIGKIPLYPTTFI